MMICSITVGVLSFLVAKSPVKGCDVGSVGEVGAAGAGCAVGAVVSSAAMAASDWNMIKIRKKQAVKQRAPVRPESIEKRWRKVKVRQ